MTKALVYSDERPYTKITTSMKFRHSCGHEYYANGKDILHRSTPAYKQPKPTQLEVEQSICNFLSDLGIPYIHTYTDPSIHSPNNAERIKVFSFAIPTKCNRLLVIHLTGYQALTNPVHAEEYAIVEGFYAYAIRANDQRYAEYVEVHESVTNACDIIAPYILEHGNLSVNTKNILSSHCELLGTLKV